MSKAVKKTEEQINALKEQLYATTKANQNNVRRLRFLAEAIQGEYNKPPTTESDTEKEERWDKWQTELETEEFVDQLLTDLIRAYRETIERLREELKKGFHRQKSALSNYNDIRRKVEDADKEVNTLTEQLQGVQLTHIQPQ